MTDYNDGSWHGWNGGECPVHPETIVEVRWKYNPARQTARAGEFCAVGQWTWEGVGNRIVAFRVVKEHREPRECWVHKRTMLVRWSCPDDEYMENYIYFREVME